MSKLDELIAELCPDGVEYKKLGEISTISRGGNFQKKDFSDEGVPCIHYGQIYTRYGLFVKDTISFIDPALAKKQKMAVKNDIVMAVTSENIDDVCRCVAYFGEQPAAVSGHTAIIHHNQDAKFLVYYLHSSMFFSQKQKLAHGTKVIEVTPDKLNDVEVPVPPVEVQREVVRVLDNFTLLRQELSAELSARRKQYEYYRNQVLRFDSGTKRIALGDLFDFRNGLSKGKAFFGKGTPFIRYTDVYNNRSLRKKDITALVECTSDEIEKLRVSRGDVLFTRTSETAEDVGWSSVMLDDIGDCVFNGFSIRATPTTDKLLPEYCAFCFTTDDFRDYVTRNCAFTTRASLTGKTIAEYKLAVPPISVQQKIACFLENFEAICNDLNIGLPAEIEARTEQYEFYRDQLLTFAESRKTILTTGRPDDRTTGRPDDRTTGRPARHSLIKLLQYVFGYADAKLSDMADVFRGEYITKKGMPEGNVPVILGGQEPAYYINKSNHEGEIVVVARSGVSAGFVSYWDEPVFVTDGFGYEAVEGIVMPKFLYYILKNREAEMNSMKRGAGVPHVSGEALGDMEFIIPSIERQKEIVATLDRFDDLCNDIESGIPAEIEARTKQYEYYRDKLLTFKRKQL